MESIRFGNDWYSNHNIPSSLQKMRVNCPPDSVKLRWTLKHKNYLRCIFPVEETNETVYERPGRLVPLKEYIETLKSQGKYPVTKHDLTGYFYIPNEYRKLLRSMVQFIAYIHSKGLCTLGFSMGEIAVLDGELKFYKIDFKESEDIESRVNDRRNISDIISQIMASSLATHALEMGNLPYMRMFISILIDGARVGSILVDHVAVLSFQEIGNFVVEANEKSKMFSTDDYLLIMRKLKAPHLSFNDIAMNDNSVWGQHVRDFGRDGPFEQCP